MLRRAGHAALLTLVLAGAAMATGATEFKFGDAIEGSLNGTATAGTTIRTESADPALLGTLSPGRVGLPPGQLAGNSGGNDLNFKRDRPVSTVAKAMLDLELRHANIGFFARTKIWYDFELKDGDRAYGNIPNGFRQNAPLSDNGFDPATKFSNARLADVYAFGHFNLDVSTPLDVRVGRQALKWGTSQFIGGGIDAINPADFPAQQRPGALNPEGKVPVGLLYANLGSGKTWGVDGFMQYEFRPTIYPGCGTFYTTANFLSTGCPYVSVVRTIDDPTTLASGMYPKRNADILARDSGQYGISLRYSAESLNTDFRAYTMSYHNRNPMIRVFNPNIAGGYGATVTERLTDPNGLRFSLIYPEAIRLYGLSFETKLDPATRLFGELAWRPNQPLGLNSSDLISAFVARPATSALNLSKNTNALAPGSTFDSFDRFGVTTASFGGSKAFRNALGAAEVVLRGEIGLSHVAGLPEPGALRYGRSDDYGVAAINGVACTDTTPAQKSCALDGFVTTNAWGYRLRLAANYAGAFLGADLKPSIGYAHDVDGYSYDGTFQKGRKVLRPGLRADWGKKYFADLQYTAIAGGKYNTQIDRDNVSLVVGANF